MSTNPKGRYFISYRRSPARKIGTQEAEILRAALRDRGAPTWRDLDDLAPEPTEDELVAILNDPNTAGAVMLVSPEVAASPIIRNVEARRIFKRHGAKDGFIVKPVLIGLDYGEANAALNAPAGFQNLGDWNLHKLEADAVTEADARAVARDVVRTRLKAIADAAPDAPLDIALFSRRGGGPGPFALHHDFTPYFDGRTAEADTYRQIETALVDTASAVASVYNDVPIVGRGNAALPLGVLYGAVFSPLADFRVSWLQGLAGHEKETWSLASGQSGVRLQTPVTNGDAASEDIVLALGVSADIEMTVSEFLNATGLKPRASIHAAIEAGSVPQGVPLSPQDGLTIVLQAVQAARALKDDLGLRRARLHLFLACPLAMAVLLGQKLNTFSECVIYEHDPDATPSYRCVHAFNPSGFTYYP